MVRGVVAGPEDQRLDAVGYGGDLGHVDTTGAGFDLYFEAESDEMHLLVCATNARLALEEGITTLRDCGARNEVIFTFKGAVDRGLVPSPRLLAAGGAITRTGGYGSEMGVEVDLYSVINPDLASYDVAGERAAGH